MARSVDWPARIPVTDRTVASHSIVEDQRQGNHMAQRPRTIMESVF